MTALEEVTGNRAHGRSFNCSAAILAEVVFGGEAESDETPSSFAANRHPTIGS